MSIKHTAISYYGFNYVEHAEKDFREMIDHGVDTVLLAITEFDMDFWFPNINAIVKKAHEMGLRVIADTWGIGKYFGSEQVSLFLQNNIHHRQVSAYTGEVLNAACFNTNSFRDYFERLRLKLARETEVDGFFWDESHYAYPKSYASITGGAGDDWACRCPECMKKFQEYYGYEMPKFMNDDVKQFRWREALETLSRVSKSLKEYNPKLEITCCVHATLNGYYASRSCGATTTGIWWQPAPISTCSPPPSSTGAFRTASSGRSPNAPWPWQGSTARNPSGGSWVTTSAPKNGNRSTTLWTCTRRRA